MKTTLAIFVLILTAAPTLRAQVVNDGATNTLSNVTTNFTGDVTVGTNGSFTMLVLSDHTLLTNSINGVIGRNATARSNEVQLISATARWRMGGTLFIGSNGAMSRLVVSNGALVDNLIGVLGQTVGSSNNSALVTGNGTLWSNRNDLRIGNSGPNNQMIVSNGGWVTSLNGGIGQSVGSSNFVLVTGIGSVWSNASGLTVGNFSAGNRLVIEAGGRVIGSVGGVGGVGTSSNNEAIVTGPGSLWINSSTLGIGGQRPFNRLVVSNGAAVKSDIGAVGNSNTPVIVTGTGSVWSNQTLLTVSGVNSRVDVSDGGKLVSADSYIGQSVGANGNTVTLAGSGSGWNNTGNLIVGDGSSDNVLIASNGATVLASNLFIGFNSASANNRVGVDAGTLRVTNASAAGVLDVRRGTNVLNAGLIEVDLLIATNSAGRIEFNGGTLSTLSSLVINGQPFRVGNGVSPATLFLAGASAHYFGASGLIISANATVTGNGIVHGVVTVLSGGTLGPGTSIGKIVLSSPPTLQGLVSMEISRNGVVLTNDQIEAGALTITYGGSLTVTNIGPNALAAGDRFQLFNAATYNGSFATVTLPPLAAPLDWENNLLVDGSIEVVVATPILLTLPATRVMPNIARLNGIADPNGADSSAWFEWGTTINYGNVTPPRPLASANGLTNLSESLTGLGTGVVHHFRLVGSNSFGVAYGADQSFTTPFPVPLLYSEDFDTDHTANWRINRVPTSDSIADFYFDYSSVGIPSAPNSDGTTRGLRLLVNQYNGTFSGLSVSPLGQNFSGDYVLTFDIWWNFIGPAPDGGSGSTQVTGAGLGTAGTTPQWAGGVQDSVYFGATGDGGSAFDYRAYSTAAPVGYTNGSPVYAAPGGDRNNTNAYYSALGGNTPPAAQTALFPQQTGTTSPGAPAFRWHAGKIVNYGNTIAFSLNDLLIATIDASTVTFGGSNILFNQFDVNSLSSTDPNDFLEFGLIDNVVVGQITGPQLHRITRLANGQIQLAGSGFPGQQYTVEAAAKLTQFGSPGTEIGTAVADSFGVIFFVDPDPPTDPQRYYRLRWP